MNVNALLEKYRALLAENHSLREENEILKARLEITDPPRPEPSQDTENHLLYFIEGDSHRVHYIRQPFQRDSDFGETSVNYDFAELLLKTEAPQ